MDSMSAKFWLPTAMGNAVSTLVDESVQSASGQVCMHVQYGSACGLYIIPGMISLMLVEVHSGIATHKSNALPANGSSQGPDAFELSA